MNKHEGAALPRGGGTGGSRADQGVRRTEGRGAQVNKHEGAALPRGGGTGGSRADQGVRRTKGRGA